ncbi:alpha/beta family hydrolase [Planctobacterium marinum]|uniref:Alpha/beta hydrolase n=1 Tax=Planctobacterium marinum TaxID=1631968 RepID=A0AA48HHD9_9ALTE|nr:alpha/beta hydrolase [Planctobacterium marinum]
MYKAHIVLAHGAGQGMESDFMQECKRLFEINAIKCTLFNFDYMAIAEETGKRRPPDRLPKLIQCFEAQLPHDKDLPLFVGGKSMGGRVATHILQDSDAIAAICLGYPFHPPGKPEKTRTEHLSQIKKSILVLQGERDPFGKPAEICGYELPGNIQVEYVKDGEHSFKTTKASGLSWQDNMQQAITGAVRFIDKVMG